MSAPSEVSERIQMARKEAETLKEQIRANREAMNDTTRMCFCCYSPLNVKILLYYLLPANFYALTQHSYFFSSILIIFIF